MSTKTKTIKMLLYSGSINGVINISNSAWESGKMYAAPRDSIEDLVSRADCKKYGVYLLLSEQLVYVGQARDLERRTRQHLADKDWWSQVILMTTKDDSFNASDIDYLESRLIDLAVAAGKSDTDNKKRGNPQKVDEFRQAELEQYLEEALFILELIGIKVFKKDQNINKQNRCKRKNAPSTHQESLLDHTTRLESLTDDSDKLKTLQDEQDILHLKGNVFAQGKVCDDGFLVLKNSCLSVNISPSCPPSVIKMRESLLREGKVNEGIFVVDVKFASPSAAATCIKGCPVNGKKDWCYSDGKSIKDKG
jgi:hypothetical protein